MKSAPHLGSDALLVRGEAKQSKGFMGPVNPAVPQTQRPVAKLGDALRGGKRGLAFREVTRHGVCQRLRAAP